MKLNGWQRLWVFASVVIGCISLGVGAAVYPSLNWAEEVNRNQIAKLADIQKNLENSPAAQPDTPWENYPRFGGEIVTLANLKEMKANLAAENAQRMQHVKEEQRSTAFFAVGTWLGLSLVLYLLGWFIAWIIRGFRADKARP